MIKPDFSILANFGIQWVKVTWDVPLRELNAQRLHHGLSETILVNTRTDIRELKKYIMLSVYKSTKLCYNLCDRVPFHSLVITTLPAISQILPTQIIISQTSFPVFCCQTCLYVLSPTSLCYGVIITKWFVINSWHVAIFF